MSVYAKYIRLVFICIVTALTSCGLIPSTISLVENGQSPYTIIIPLEANETERFAAQELQQYLKQISNASLPISTELFSGQTPQIFGTLIITGRQIPRIL